MDFFKGFSKKKKTESVIIDDFSSDYRSYNRDFLYTFSSWIVHFKRFSSRNKGAPIEDF